MKTLLKNLIAATTSKATSICLSALLILLGCASPKSNFQSKKDPSYEKKLDRILVVYVSQAQDKLHVASQHLGAEFSDRLAKQITVLLAQKSVPCDIVRLEDELDRNVPINAAAARFGAKQDLYFWVRSVRRKPIVNSLAYDTTITLEFSLWDRQIKKTVWRTEATFFGCSPLADDTAKQLVHELGTAGLL
jgi:hypothetical protein